MLLASGWLQFGYLRVKQRKHRQATLAVLRQARRRRIQQW